jgi:lysophospholipase L1-like esterase
MLKVKDYLNNIFLLFLSLIFTLLLIEMFLLIYNPFQSRVKGFKIILPVNKEITFFNNTIPKLDATIVHNKNSLGFRGAEPKHEFSKYLTIITIGGSTTECYYLSDGKTWPDRLGNKLKKDFHYLWINNAGLDGHTTFGHFFLMNEYLVKMKPKIVLLLVGQNDIGNENFSEFDVENLKTGLYFKSAKGFIKSMASYSEVISTGLNIYRSLLARQRGLLHNNIKLNELNKLEISDITASEIITAHKQKKYLRDYQQRLRELIKISRENDIKLVFMTQPALYGDMVDDITGVDLGKIFTTAGFNGKISWEILQLYNDITRSICKEDNVLLIDLAKEMPKSSRYYYDFLHYTNDGAEKVAEITYQELAPFLQKTYPEYCKTDVDN